MIDDKKIWIEKTLVRNRSHREEGEYKLGSALWSPQKDKRGADIYANMREIRKGDLILHFIDNERFSGVSRVAEEYSEKFYGIKDSDWSNKPAYLIKLEQYTELEYSIHRNDFLGNPKYSNSLRKLQNTESVFYTSGLALRQGGYITRAPFALVEILNEIYFGKTAKHLPFFQNDNFENNSGEKSTAYDTRYNLLKTKKQIILYGPPGTGKTFNTKKIALELLGRK